MCPIKRSRMVLFRGDWYAQRGTHAGTALPGRTRSENPLEDYQSFGRYSLNATNCTISRVSVQWPHCGAALPSGTPSPSMIYACSRRRLHQRVRFLRRMRISSLLSGNRKVKPLLAVFGFEGCDHAAYAELYLSYMVFRRVKPCGYFVYWPLLKDIGTVYVAGTR